MVDRPNRPSALASTPGLSPQPQVTIAGGRVTAVLPTGESVEVLLYGATVLSWKDAAGDEKLWVSEAASLDGSKPVRGGIPIAFPVFGTAPDHEATVKLPQHGFARISTWEFLGKSTSEGSSDSVKLDFGLSANNIDDSFKADWPHKFGVIYSVSLDRDSLTTAIVISNEGDESFEVQTLMHTYFRVKDISTVEISGLESSPYLDKVEDFKEKLQSDVVTITSQTDRVYTPIKGPEHPVVITDSGKPRFRIVRDNLNQVVVWNPYAARTADFAPQDGWKHMVCVEAGAVGGWQKLDKGDTFEGAQTMFLS